MLERPLDVVCVTTRERDSRSPRGTTRSLAAISERVAGPLGAPMDILRLLCWCGGRVRLCIRPTTYTLALRVQDTPSPVELSSLPPCSSETRSPWTCGMHDGRRVHGESHTSSRCWPDRSRKKTCGVPRVRRLPRRFGVISERIPEIDESNHLTFVRTRSTSTRFVRRFGDTPPVLEHDHDDTVVVAASFDRASTALLPSQSHRCHPTCRTR